MIHPFVVYCLMMICFIGGCIFGDMNAEKEK